ncbi:acyl carrier protein [Castellaniella sp. GW247-6E4]|uniref:acyl carrier protein n=1 Tax=Castellaniella sp. GW247-6E4 TaxID=3140380 RepID=UPI003315D74B
MTTIQTKVYAIVSEQLCIPESEITPDSNLSSLGADSLDKVEIVMVIEDDFQIEIPDAELEEIETVRQLIELIGRLRS